MYMFCVSGIQSILQPRLDAMLLMGIIVVPSINAGAEVTIDAAPFIKHALLPTVRDILFSLYSMIISFPHSIPGTCS